MVSICFYTTRAKNYKSTCLSLCPVRGSAPFPEAIAFHVYHFHPGREPIRVFFPECVAKGSRLTLGGLGVEPCSRPVASMFATVRNRSQPSATVRSRSLRRCHWGKLLQVTFHGCVTCQFAPLFHCDLHEKDMARKQRDAFRCTGAAFGEICRLLRSSIGISVWRVVFLGCWMWPCHWDLRFRVSHRSSVFVTSLS